MSLEVVAIIDADTAHTDEVRQALVAMLGPTRAEAGCLRYELFTASTQLGRFVMMERWAGHQALDAHMETAHMAQLKARIDGKITNLTILPLTPVA